MPREPNRAYLLAVLLLLVGLRKAGCSTSAPRYPVCKPGFEFWSVERATCWPCTRCAPEFTLSPCAIYKDAICGPLSALELDWSFLSTRKRPETGQRSLEAVTSKMLWRFPDLDQQQIRQESKDFADNSQTDIQSKTKNQVLNESPYPRSAASSKERILWDWQTVALILAVCACILFFLVAGCSALVYARQWRRMKKNFEPVGKLSSPLRAPLREEEIFCNLKVAKQITLNSYKKYLSRGVHANASRTLSLYFMGVTKQKMLYKRRLNKALSKSCNKSIKYGRNGLVVSVL
ncbi:tumor necrosis factor receptor superfamily member wengen isoform X2 [Bombus pyrosoma]|uniref:tumor necrosis factor receptor superfamily member wengen isoform X2 n=1 Tax=Bombus pyrosoma TaxID=396416 RepID=UPI001CB8BE2C|nr:tumor necrosis factor receptor superfamily member wengen isoform X2 [Bombus pyrosoma]